MSIMNYIIHNNILPPQICPDQFHLVLDFPYVYVILIFVLDMFETLISCFLFSTQTLILVLFFCMIPPLNTTARWMSQIPVFTRTCSLIQIWPPWPWCFFTQACGSLGVQLGTKEKCNRVRFQSDFLTYGFGNSRDLTYYPCLTIKTSY